MSDNAYTVPKVWTWDAESGGKFANINRPVSGATHDAPLKQGDHPFQLHSLATPNGQKVTILFEELLDAGFDAEYDAWPIRISDGEQFGAGFVSLNPNSKIPALLDRSGPVPVRLFESGAILLHLADKFGAFIPKDGPERAEVLSWLFWQMGSGPFLGGAFGHFFAYAPEPIEYAINRYAMEAKRLFDVLDKRLGVTRYLGGADYSIADIAAWPWFAGIALGKVYERANEFLDTASYKNMMRWADEIGARPAVNRGVRVNRTWGDAPMPERHSAADFDQPVEA